MSDVTLETLKFGGLFGDRWKPNDRLFILGIDEEDKTEFTFVGRPFSQFLNEVPVPWLNGSRPDVRTAAFLDAVDRGWSSVSSFQYVGSVSSSRYRRHCVVVQTWNVPEVARDNRKAGFQPVGADLTGLFTRTEKEAIRQMRAAYHRANQSAVA